MSYQADILVIGAGITGCAVARELSRYNASVTVLESAYDIAEGATKANSGIVHAGYDARPGTKKALYNIRGAAMYESLCTSLHVPYRRNGALVIALNDNDIPAVEALKSRGLENGVENLEILDHDAVLSLEPNISPEVRCALHIPGSAVISPYETAFALADHAAVNGVSFRFDETVLSAEHLPDGCFSVKTNHDTYTCRVLVNCAGASGADIHNQLSEQKLTMIHRRGQYYLLDRETVPAFSHTIFQCPSPMGKGVLVSPTVHGNLLLGPTAEDITDPSDTATTAEGLDEVIRKAAMTWPRLSVRSNITNFSGIRAHLTTDDFVIGPCEDCPGLFEAIGIESPGLSSAPAVGQDLAEMIARYLNLPFRDPFLDCPEKPRPFNEMTDAEKAEAISSDPSYGNIICRCEVVTEAEIRAAVHRPVGARSVDGVKRRTRAGMGRCQGGFCMPRVAEIISAETGLPLDKVTKNGGNSYILAGTVDSFLKEETVHD
ncbi:NAD(P)/FAD-dependent oxidoreductase [Aristaeella lactis]|uniref:Glycerol-3-phosphate dehydrogenase n=1 Tax=Aristaeella lactis TaxID=3046383 RepID=A0AC61PI69_9FIRM|nr:NAD(P)/FAD-dependent oxidoreductase [Aristaeella lactis]QUA53722.1 NAD(P)/FAD-dependent oxidoreductase [Aristaeella lactis]SMC38785.1 glycerol-3-phosphate dehydrogenase [Aristaeella lactis]